MCEVTKRQGDSSEPRLCTTGLCWTRLNQAMAACSAGACVRANDAPGACHIRAPAIGCDSLAHTAITAVRGGATQLVSCVVLHSCCHPMLAVQQHVATCLPAGAFAATKPVRSKGALLAATCASGAAAPQCMLRLCCWSCCTLGLYDADKSLSATRYEVNEVPGCSERCADPAAVC